MTSFGIFRRKERNKENEGNQWKSQGLRLLFWVAVLVQIIDVFVLKFNRTNGFPIAIFMYLGLAVWALVVLKKPYKNTDEYEFDDEDYENRHHIVNPFNLLVFLAISAFYVLVPFFLWLVPNITLTGGTSLADWVNFFLAILPAWPIYIGIRGKSRVVHWYVNFWIIVIIFIFIFGFASNLNVGSIVSQGGRPTLVEFGPVWQYLVDQTQTIYSNFLRSFRTIKIDSFFIKLANATGMNYYYGMSDRSDRGPVGLYLDQVRTMDRYFYQGYPVVIWADIRGKSFTEEIRVRPECYIEKVGAGVAEPESISILGEEHDTLSCTFDNLSKGSYRASVKLWFNFETWGYVTYTFVDQEVKRSLEMQGKNVNSELDIPVLPMAVYSNGPVMLGMGSMVDQPVGISRLNPDAPGPVLGVTLDNNVGGGWSEGKISGPPDEFEIQIPNDFTLVNCDRWYPEKTREPYKTVEGYDFYKFTPAEIGDPRQEFKSVTCRLHIKDPQALLAGAQKVQRTFVSRVKYNYELEKPISIIVRE
jgi:hypothetical protein